MHGIRFAWLVVWALLSLAGTSEAQLAAENDGFGVPFGEDLVVESPGVLDNDTFGGEPAGDAGAVVDLPVIVDAAHGTLVLNSDGSFSYAPGPSFPGTDTFTYQVSIGMETAQATVTISACDTGPTVFTCWMESPYQAKLAELGFGSLQEGFEDDAVWGGVRYPNTAPSVVSQGINWQTNHADPPASNEIVTGGGAATGDSLWGVYDPNHGYATGTTVECDTDNPPASCLYLDGVTGSADAGTTAIYGAGAFFTGTHGANIVAYIDGGAPIGLGKLSAGTEQFFGVIDPAGFTTFRFEEIDGKVGQRLNIFADDFTIGTDATEIFTDGFEGGTTGAWTDVFPP